ncbi:ABC transporter substrate-binding protein [Nonomuraea sp. NPDC050153]|uniref:ABC transporter substrate-binding protein n=1 Tax=Nonomuraea sp. NPDC050153 TaxID=3364359 RepID=UPI003788E9E4
MYPSNRHVDSIPGASALSRRTLLGGLAALGAAGLTGCRSAVNESKTAAAAGGPARGGTMVATVAAAPDPAAYFTGRPGNIFWNRNVLETLVMLDQDNKPQPLLATKWELRDDNRTLVLSLREGVKFHSGRAFTADDVVFTLERELAGDGLATLTGAMKGWKASATGQHEVTITSPRPLQEVVLDILDSTPIIDRESYKGIADGSKVIGTGPFLWSGYKAGTEIKMTRNDAYWEQGLPYLDGIELTVIGDSTAQLAALRSGRAHLANGLTIQDAKTVVDDKKFHLDLNHGLVYALGFDVTKAPFDKPEVRRAIGYAIDRQRINQQVFGGVGTTTSLPWSDDATGYPAELAATYSYQPDRAKQMIQAAGAAGARFEIAMHALPVPRNVIEIVARNLTDVGLQPSPLELPQAEFEPRRIAGKLGPAFLTWTAVAKMPPALSLFGYPDLRPAKNTSNYDDDGYRERAQALIDSADESETTQRLKELSQYLIDAAFLQTIAIVPATVVRASTARDILVSRYGRSMRAAYLTR